VLNVQKEGLTAIIKVQLTTPAVVTASISREAADDLNIRVEDELEAVVKATEVMIAE
jgi:molybdopterin-binding protein